MEGELIKAAKQYLEDINNPKSEILSDKLFNLAGQVNAPKTEAGQSIIAYVQVEMQTGYSLAAGDEFEAMQLAVSAA